MIQGDEEPDQLDARTEVELYTEVISNSVLGWSIFVDTAIESNIYRVARETYGAQKAARIALFRLYLESFTLQERKELLENPDYFLQYAFGVVRELYPPHPKNRKTIVHNRLIFFISIRQFLEAERRISRHRFEEAVQILRAASQMSRSVEDIVRARDLYREFQFRVAAQRNLDWIDSFDVLPLEVENAGDRNKPAL
ncbi:MAG: hypothetical protein CMN76_21100 [Spirochaetaceae bacterium]|nr:hypothetical protein [Spirochaetaceae bacterium]|tara:strand:+ start:38901 stop:39491 length:591 start_codon:yes stop_codon:yes gene_type:complete